MKEKFNNIHIYPSNMLFESRIYKIAGSIKALNIYDNIILLGINDGNLPIKENLKDNIYIHRLNIETSSWLKKGFISKVLNVIKLSSLTFKFLKQKKPKVVHAHNLASLPVAVIYKIFYKTKVVYDTHEFETEREGWSPFIRKFSKIVEKILIKYADITVVVNEAIGEYYQKDYGIKPVSILNVPEIGDINEGNYFREKYQIAASTKIFIYLGAFTESRGIMRYIDFINKTNLDICFIFMGKGAKLKEMERLLTDSKKAFIHYSVDQKTLKNILGSADYSLQTLSFKKDLSLSYKLALCNKFFESCMAKLPMIGGGFEVQKMYMEKYSIGIEIENSDFDSIEKGIINLLELNINSLKQNCEIVFNEFNWEKESKKITNYYKEYII